jgi:hypothetical protein
VAGESDGDDGGSWTTDDDLRAARLRFEAAIPGYVEPSSYAVARRDPDGTLVFGHVNRDGLHRLPSAVLATVCGHVAGPGSYELTTAQLEQAVDLLAPAEAATHWDHPNLWSWRGLLADAPPGSSYVAFFDEGIDVSPRQ